MCGIAGIIVQDRARLPGIGPLLQAMAHRGPDGEGMWSEDLAEGGAVVLGHRRLSIIDLSDAASQPMADATGRYEMTFNGEIYNYIEVRTELKALGVVFRTQSDSEVILEAYKKWGEDCLRWFNGMFALAIFDRQAKTLFCARDRYGEKPFLYVSKPGLFAFASEYKALLILPGVSAEYDEFRLLQAAREAGSGLDADEQTVFRDIFQLLPGEALRVDVVTLAQHRWRYYEPTPGIMRDSADEADIFAEFRELLTDAVRLRMRSDVKVGSCLSGGLDSSAIVCLVRQLVGDEVPYYTFTGQFPGTYADESAYARLVADATHVETHTVEPDVDGFIDDLPEFVWNNELPVGSSSQYAQWRVFKLAKEHGVTVLLDGQGSDEILGGYEQYFGYYVRSLEARGETARLAREMPAIRQRYPNALAEPARAWRSRLPLGMRHTLANTFGFGSDILYGMERGVAQRVAVSTVRPEWPQFHPLGAALAQDSFGRFLTTLLRYGDRNSMAHSREVRLPFCDHRLAEFVFTMPPHMLMGDVQTKRLLRESMRGILPEPIRTRWNKQGFRPPQDLWFQSKRFLGLVRDTLESSSFRQSPLWNGSTLRKMLDRVEQGELGLGWTLWHPFMIEMWRQNFLKRLA
jgi:asparagine synthase (glutamine-hydrolysing)